MFTEKFSPDFASPEDSISCEIDGFRLVATIYRDDDATSPDKRDCAFWPSLDPKSDGYIGDKSKRTLAREMAKAKAVLKAWQNDEWFYCGIAVVAFKHDVQLTGDFDHALWGVECNYPDSKNGYLLDVANQHVDECLTAARAKIAALSAA